MNNFYAKSSSLKSQGYRRYNQAFYEEILIDYNVESRVAQNYRERFLVSSEDVFLVLQMYAQNDYVSHFLRVNTEEIQHEQFMQLFQTCLRNDSFKIAFQIYLRYLGPADFNAKIMDILILSLRDSVKYHEFKIFFILEYFDILSVYQMNLLVDIYMEILHRKDYKMNPMLSQYNTIKYSLLIYRISWKIDQKKIYSLITKCQLLNNYIQRGISNYLERQNHIAQLYKFMREPIFHMTEKKDSLDIMLEMNMESLLKHPVIVEILNLVYEGKYSIDSSVMSLSQTFQQFFLMQTNDMKSINERLVQNIRTCGDSSSGKQASLQFNIWKQCIEQREKDEMLFTSLLSVIVLGVIFFIDIFTSNVVHFMEAIYGKQLFDHPELLAGSTPQQLQDFCGENMSNMLRVYQVIQLFQIIVIFNGIGFLTAIIQKLAITRLRNNVQLSYGRLCLELSLVITSVINYQISRDTNLDTRISERCASDSAATGFTVD